MITKQGNKKAQKAVTIRTQLIHLQHQDIKRINQ